MNISLLLNDMSSVLGSCLLLYAYYMVSTNKWDNNTRRFYAVNFFGAIFALLGVIERFNISVVMIEVVFGYLSFRGYLRLTAQQKLAEEKV